MDDRRAKVCEIANAVGISSERVHNILHQHLNMRKLSARWVPRLLTVDQKRNRVRCSKDNCSCFSGIHRTLGVVSSLWTKHGYTTTLLRPRTLKTMGSQWGVCTKEGEDRSFSRESYGDSLLGFSRNNPYLEKGKTITGESYSSLLDRMKIELQEKCPQLAHKKILFHHDNAPAHASGVAAAKLELGSNSFHIRPILQIWLPRTIICSPIRRNGWREGDFIQTRK